MILSILVSECPIGMVYQQCGSLCPATCDDMTAPTMCQEGCAEGCFCPDGEVTDSKGQCVEHRLCPGQ